MTYAPCKRPDFLLIAGSEHLLSAAANGAKAMFSPLAGVAPKLVRQLFDCCRDDKLFEARKPQEDIGGLLQLLKKSDVAHLKAGSRAMGRDCGDPRPPLQALDDAASQNIWVDLNARAVLRDEPRGW
jgi:dihydrodipicolinate synthase/N-acetylneuraminate lyase